MTLLTEPCLDDMAAIRAAEEEIRFEAIVADEKLKLLNLDPDYFCNKTTDHTSDTDSLYLWRLLQAIACADEERSGHDLELNQKRLVFHLRQMVQVTARQRAEKRRLEMEEELEEYCDDRR